ncbi:MAG TPA: NAD(P)-binding oxidoreductase [Streptosporangiaceae bacterium]|jgi:putative NADH-flavin reductase
MRLTIFGATGATGTSLVEQALASGHDVTVVVRDPARLTATARGQARVITADVMDPGAITAAVTGADAVLTAIGPRGTGPTTVSRDSVSSIIQAIRKADVRRLLVVSGSIVADAGESPYLRYLIKPIARRTFLRHVSADMRAAEQEVRASDLDWTILRPPALSDKPAKGSYRTAVDRNLPRGFTVPRADLAACMLSLTGDRESVHRHVAIAS